METGACAPVFVTAEFTADSAVVLYSWLIGSLPFRR